jgi:ribosomal protein S18 acetylase RimI-like enzyme
VSKFIITPLKPDQWQEYKNIRLESLKNDPQAYFAAVLESVQKPDSYWRERLIEAQEGKKSWLLFAKEGNSIIGIIGAFIKEKEDIANIISLYVSVDSRRKGVSKLLMKSMLTVLEKNLTNKSIRLAVNVDQSPAINLYKSFGFQIFEMKNSLLGDGKYHDEYIMIRSLQ